MRRLLIVALLGAVAACGPDGVPNLPPGVDPSTGATDDMVHWFTEAPEPTDQDVRDLIAAASSRLRGTPSP